MILGTLDTDGLTVVSIQADPTTHGLKIDDDTTGTSYAIETNQRDANRVPTVWATSSDDGETPIYIATDSSGKLLIDST